jgi:hypothetical protein
MRTSHAYTLLETLIGLLLVGMILAALHSGLWVGVHAYQAGRRTANRRTMLTAAKSLLADDLANLRPQGMGSGPSLILHPVGDGGFCLRLERQARGAPEAVPSVIDYFFMPGPGATGKLFRRAERTGWSWQSESPADDRVVQYEFLVGRLGAATLRAFAGERWSDAWDSQHQDLPRLIELRLEHTDEHGRHEFTAVVPVMVQASLLEENRS